MASPAAVRHRSAFQTNQVWLGASLLVVFGIALRYVVHYALPYFGFDPNYFAEYWPHRVRLITHISGGMLALITGPFQFWTGLRNWNLTVHRWTGRLYLVGIVVGSTGSLLMAVFTTPRSFGISLTALATAWIFTTGTAYAAILRGMVQLHKEWMGRSYIVTFGFVAFRWLDRMQFVAKWGTFPERAANVAWICWVAPLFVYELILAGRRIWLKRAA